MLLARQQRRGMEKDGEGVCGVKRRKKQRPSESRENRASQALGAVWVVGLSRGRWRPITASAKIMSYMEIILLTPSQYQPASRSLSDQDDEANFYSPATKPRPPRISPAEHPKPTKHRGKNTARSEKRRSRDAPERSPCHSRGFLSYAHSNASIQAEAIDNVWTWGQYASLSNPHSSFLILRGIKNAKRLPSPDNEK
nr:hypothetical protein CFP56_42196 [Quercus suber]